MKYEPVVSGAAMLCMGAVALLSFCIPVVLCIWFRKKKKADLVPFFVGMAVMFLFALTLESLLHVLVLTALPVGKTISGNIWLYAVYGGLMAGLFEETGRFLAFRTVLKRYRKKDINALMYGAGHGGFEAAWVLGGTMISNIVMGVMLNLGMSASITATATAEQLPQLEAMFEALKTGLPASYFIGLIERVLAVAMQLSLSVFVWFAAKQKGKVWLYPAAILLHALVDGILTVAAYFISSIWIVYAILLAETLVVVLLAWLVWKRNKSEEPAIEPAEAQPDADQAV